MSENVVETTHGRVRGVVHAGHVAYLGLRYAMPPVGPRRFTAPAPAEPWAGVQEAERFGFACPQPPSVLPGMEPGPQGEDCLFLNVYAPRGGGGRKPVLVWLHGGGFSAGSAAQAIYDGGRLAARGDAVVVTVNYRLGPLGFLHLPALGADVPGAVDDPGLLDQLAALAWVRDNAAAFGGDPGNVTIFGESAGAMSVATLVACPAARGLVRRAIAQSGAAQATLDRDTAARTAH
ncbi:MAG: carboxylesterase family protein, partial [Thermodesulfobacteriota bacterium]